VDTEEVVVKCECGGVKHITDYYLLGPCEGGCCGYRLELWQCKDCYKVTFS
jgi:hypothetical protein